MPENILLILTVGTGTAGNESFIAEGLRRTVELLQPRRFWLVPSDSPASIEVADFIREDFPQSFAPWSDQTPYNSITEPDRLGCCRATIRTVINRAREELGNGERLIVNPTSGTKQMSAGATIAALDEGLGELAFTIGDRADGVVRTGTERIETFNASTYHAEKDKERASILFASGAYSAAARLLNRHASLRDLASYCLCLHEWQRQNYKTALEISKQCSDPRIIALIKVLRTLAKDASGKAASPRIAGDLLTRATASKDTGDHEQALFLACKAAERALDHLFQKSTGLIRPYPSEQLKQLSHWSDIDQKKIQTYKDGKKVHLLTGQILAYLQNEGMIRSQHSKELRSILDSRNELVHHLRPVSHDEAHLAIGVVRRLFSSLAIPIPPALPKTL